MKRLIAMLLTLTLLTAPLISIADQVRTVISCQSEAEELAHYLTAYGLPQEEATTWAGYAAPILNDLNIAVLYNTVAESVSLKLGDTPLIDLALEVQTGFLQTSLLPGLTMKLATSFLAEDNEHAGKLIFNENLNAQLREVAAHWVDELPWTEELGFFYGDAYSGAFRRQTVQLDDTQVAEVLNALTDSFIAWQAANGGDADAAATLIDNLRRTYLEPWPSANLYTYRLIRAYGLDGQMVGISLTVYQGEEQVLTVSIGAADDHTTRIVLGLGTDWGVFYADTYVSVAGDGRGQYLVQIAATICQDTRGVGFAGAAETPLATITGSITNYASTYTSTLTSNWTVTQAYGTTRSDTRVLTTNLLDGAHMQITSFVYAGEDKNPCMTWSITSAPTTDTLDPIDIGNTTLLDFSDKDFNEEIVYTYLGSLTDAIKAGTTKLIIRLFKYLPAEMLTEWLFKLAE